MSSSYETFIWLSAEKAFKENADMAGIVLGALREDETEPTMVVLAGRNLFLGDFVENPEVVMYKSTDSVGEIIDIAFTSGPETARHETNFFTRADGCWSSRRLMPRVEANEAKILMCSIRRVQWDEQLTQRETASVQSIWDDEAALRAEESA